MKATKAELAEIKRCQASFSYFCKYIKIVDKNSKLIFFKPNTSQKQIFEHISTVDGKWSYILKSRQIGTTTAIAAYFFWKVLFIPHFRLVCLAHRGLASQKIFKIYFTMWENLPSFLKFPCTTDNRDEFTLFHGGSINICGSDSKTLQGSTVNAIHASEFATYPHLKSTIASIFPAVNDGQIIIETTANGLNDAYKLWINPNSGFSNLFLPWTMHEEYAQGKAIGGASLLTTWEAVYKDRYKLNLKQMSFVRQTLTTICGGNTDVFNEMFPASADIAFIHSGTKYFMMSFTDAVTLNSREATGLNVYSQPTTWGRYLLGVDIASGNPNGDYHAICIIDISAQGPLDPVTLKPTRGPINIVATYRERGDVFQFCNIVYELATKYKALVVVENNQGMPILQHLRSKLHPYIYRKVSWNKLVQKYTEKLGWNTNATTRPFMLSKLQEAVSLNLLAFPPACPILRNEMNSFVWRHNRPEADTGCHDDLIFATALALMGLEQASSYEDDMIRNTRPKSALDICNWEMKHGMLYEQALQENLFDDAPPRDELCMSDLLAT